MSAESAAETKQRLIAEGMANLARQQSGYREWGVGYVGDPMVVFWEKDEETARRKVADDGETRLVYREVGPVVVAEHEEAGR